MNPLGMIVFLALMLYLLYAMIVVGAGLRRLRLKPVPISETRFLRVLGLVLIVANWLYLMLRERGFHASF